MVIAPVPVAPVPAMNTVFMPKLMPLFDAVPKLSVPPLATVMLPVPALVGPNTEYGPTDSVLAAYPSEAHARVLLANEPFVFSPVTLRVAPAPMVVIVQFILLKIKLAKNTEMSSAHVPWSSPPTRRVRSRREDQFSHSRTRIGVWWRVALSNCRAGLASGFDDPPQDIKRSIE